MFGNRVFFGWWLLLAAIIAALVWAAMQAYKGYARRRPIRFARKLIDVRFAAVQSGQLSAVDFLHEGNEILKRVLVRGLDHLEYARLSGDAWLEALDEMTATDRFTKGPGQILGNVRFSPAPDVDPATLRDELQLVLTKAPT